MVWQHRQSQRKEEGTYAEGNERTNERTNEQLPLMPFARRQRNDNDDDDDDDDSVVVVVVVVNLTVVCLLPMCRTCHVVSTRVLVLVV